MDRNIVNNILEIQESYELTNKLMEVLEDKQKREMVFNQFLQYEDDLSYDWFTEYFQQEQGDRNALKQDFTPDCICEIVKNISDSGGGNIADICSGTGGLTIKIWNNNKDSFFHCEEVSKRAIPVLLFNLAIRGINGEVLNIDVLTREITTAYKLTRNGKYSDIEEITKATDKKYDRVIMNPPYSLKWSGEADERCEGFGIPPKSKADYMFVLHGLQMMKADGKLLAILPHGVLFRGAGEGKIRETLVKSKLISSIVGFPNNLFLNTGIPTFLLELKHNSSDTLVIDASKEFIKGKSKNDMTEEHIQTVVNAHKMRRNIDKLAYVTNEEEIAENGYNLNIPRYVDTYEPEEVPDLKELLKDVTQIREEIKETEINLFKLLQEMVGTTSEDDKEQKEITNQFKRYIESKNGQMELEI